MNGLGREPRRLIERIPAKERDRLTHLFGRSLALLLGLLFLLLPAILPPGLLAVRLLLDALAEPDKLRKGGDLHSFSFRLKGKAPKERQGTDNPDISQRQEPEPGARANQPGI